VGCETVAAGSSETSDDAVKMADKQPSSADSVAAVSAALTVTSSNSKTSLDLQQQQQQQSLAG